ncbi:unnamed protein product [Arctia plantaginis]|uniref:Platelet-derived growth factor (PDGF) family profile domain-containing protein n=1 Tax=Arctia plantaginis TaxID=874455 RepID=A0A8S0ZPT2_ARCPL|nr:unnamed protein product [Arctia plantaginis]
MELNSATKRPDISKTSELLKVAGETNKGFRRISFIPIWAKITSRNDFDPDISDGDYPINDDWDTDELAVLADSSSTEKPSILGVTPSAITKLGPVRTVVSAAASIAATNVRPRIIPDPNMSPKERRQLISAVMERTNAMVHLSECLVPQPRWLIVRQLAPAADTAYTPPCVQLHRCAPDSGCCTNEEDVCAPIGGEYILLPFYLHKADGSMKVVRMQFYNHTNCACVSRDTLQSTIISRMSMGMMGVSNPSTSESQEEEKPTRIVERQNDWRTPTQEPALDKDEEETTEPPQLRRCTCPGLFLASMTDTVRCSCVCDWPDASRRRDCQSLAKGKEHFGLRDRVCVQVGNCTPPSCEYGVYDRALGRCPLRKYRRVRYHRGGRYHEKTYTV